MYHSVVSMSRQEYGRDHGELIPLPWHDRTTAQPCICQQCTCGRHQCSRPSGLSSVKYNIISHEGQSVDEAHFASQTRNAFVDPGVYSSAQRTRRGRRAGECSDDNVLYTDAKRRDGAGLKPLSHAQFDGARSSNDPCPLAGLDLSPRRRNVNAMHLGGDDRSINTSFDGNRGGNSLTTMTGAGTAAGKLMVPDRYGRVVEVSNHVALSEKRMDTSRWDTVLGCDAKLATGLHRYR